MSDAVAEAYAYCRGVTRRNARSFYFSSFALPAEKKRAAYAVYAYCRHADDLVDKSSAKDGLEESLGLLGKEFDGIVAGERSALPFAPAFAWAVQRFGIERQYFVDLLRGVSMTSAVFEMFHAFSRSFVTRYARSERSLNSRSVPAGPARRHRSVPRRGRSPANGRSQI